MVLTTYNHIALRLQKDPIPLLACFAFIPGHGVNINGTEQNKYFPSNIYLTENIWFTLTYEATYWEFFCPPSHYKYSVRLICSVQYLCLKCFQSFLFPLRRVAETPTFILTKQSFRFLRQRLEDRRFCTGPNDNKLSSCVICYKFVSEFSLDPMLYTKSNVTFDYLRASWPNFPSVKTVFLKCAQFISLLLLWVCCQSAMVYRFIRFLYCVWGRFNFVREVDCDEGNPGMKQGLARHCSGFSCYPRDLEPTGPNMCTQCELGLYAASSF